MRRRYYSHEQVEAGLLVGLIVIITFPLWLPIFAVFQIGKGVVKLVRQRPAMKGRKRA